MRSWTLESRGGELAVCRLDKDAGIPAWVKGEPFVSVSRSRDELSVTCPAGAVPAEVPREGPFRALRVAATLDFALVGVLAELLAPLAAAEVSVFVVSTFDTDWLLLPSASFETGCRALEGAGHSVVDV